MASQAAYISAKDDAAISVASDRVQCIGWRALCDAAFVEKWDALALAASEPNAFAESWFMLPALQQFDTADTVQLFAFWHGDLLAGLMSIVSSSRYGRWPIPHVQNWMHHNAFLGTPLVRAGHEVAFWEAVLDHLDDAPGSACFAHFNGLTIDGALALALEQVSSLQKRRAALVHREYRALLDGDLEPQAYYEAAVRGKKRKELRRQKNRLSEEGTLSFARFAGDEGLSRWTDEFLALERRGWKGTNGSALDCSDATRNLFRSALAGAAERGRLERLELRFDDRPLAMLVNFLCAPGSFSFKTAFDEGYSRFSPGVLLQIENLDLLTRRDIEWCDSCAAEGHPMIDSLWTGRRGIGRYSVAIGGSARRALFGALLRAELSRSGSRIQPPPTQEVEDDE